MTTKILLVDDHKIVRDGLRTLIDKESDLEVTGEAENGRTAVTVAKSLKPDIVIMDITMPDMNGIDASRMIREENPRVKVIALSMHADRRLVSGMLDAGATGYLIKDCAFEELSRAIHTVSQGHTYLSPEIADIVVKRYIGRSEEGDEKGVFTILTNREREILQLLSEGLPTRDVASRLNISRKTVETHRSNIMDKLDIHNIPELIKFAIREGLTSLDS